MTPSHVSKAFWFHKLLHPGILPRVQLNMLQNITKSLAQWDRVSPFLKGLGPLSYINGPAEDQSPCACMLQNNIFCNTRGRSDPTNHRLARKSSVTKNGEVKRLHRRKVDSEHNKQRIQTATHCIPLHIGLS